jgi:hypothetical protein
MDTQAAGDVVNERDVQMQQAIAGVMVGKPLGIRMEMLINTEDSTYEEIEGRFIAAMLEESGKVRDSLKTVLNGAGLYRRPNFFQRLFGRKA